MNDELPSLFIVPLSLIVKANDSASAEEIARASVKSRQVWEIGSVPGERIHESHVRRLLTRRNAQRKRT